MGNKGTTFRQFGIWPWSVSGFLAEVRRLKRSSEHSHSSVHLLHLTHVIGISCTKHHIRLGDTETWSLP